jgi:hypothetical protein
MQRVGLASFGPGAGDCLVLACPFHIGAPLHRECVVAGTITSIFHCEESLHIRGICATYCTCPARARQGQNDRGVTRSAECFLGGTPAIGHWTFCCGATGRWSPYSSFSLGQTHWQVLGSQ